MTSKSRRALLQLSTLLIALTFIYNNCGAGFSAMAPEGTVGIQSVPAGKNVMPVTVGGYGNQPYVSVSLCVPGTNNCRTISHLLLDSGSSGLRVFSSALDSGFINSLSGGTFGECMYYGDNSVHWGPVKTADVQLAQMKAGSVPIQIINNSYGDNGTQCVHDVTAQEQASGTYDSSNPPHLDSPSSTYNGILGVGVQYQDCGTYCQSTADNEYYYLCSGSTCTSHTLALSQQVVNPIGSFSSDNNGITLQFPSVPSGMATDIVGYAMLGVATQGNNTPASGSGVTTLTAITNINDQCYFWMRTNWNGHQICGFLDTGSNALEFPYSNTSVLPVDSYGNYVPSTVKSFSATNIGANGNTSIVQFSILDPSSAFMYNNVFAYWGYNDPSGPISGTFDWGFPFFLGRTVYVGLEGRSSSLGSGWYWAY